MNGSLDNQHSMIKAEKLEVILNRVTAGLYNKYKHVTECITQQRLSYSRHV